LALGDYDATIDGVMKVVDEAVKAPSARPRSLAERPGVLLEAAHSAAGQERAEGEPRRR
jgi:hypothetical protein